MKTSTIRKSVSLRALSPLGAALALLAAAPEARADVLAYDEHDGRSGGTVGWANDWPFARSGGELVQSAGYPRRYFNAPLGGPGATVWIAVTGRMSTVTSNYSYHVPMGVTGWSSSFQHTGLHFSAGGAQGFINNNNTVGSGFAATTKQTWLARYAFGAAKPSGRSDISVSVWTGPGAGEAIDVTAAPRLTYTLADASFDSMYAGQDASGLSFFVDRESVATSPAEALGLRRDLYVAAHQDDDLLFMSPDLARSIRSGNAVRTVYVSDGEGNTPHDMAYVSGREAGVMAAYAEMAGVENAWACGDLGVAGKTVQLCELDDRVSLVFLRLPASPQGPSNVLQALWSTPGTTVTDWYEGAAWSRSDVIAALSQLMADFRATHVGVQDSTYVHGGDHQEHNVTAHFALEAHHAYTGEHELRVYRGYNIEGEPVNLSSAEAASKEDTFRWYAACDHYMCDTSSCGEAIGCEPSGYESYYDRQYAIPAEAPVKASLQLSGSRCLEVTSTASGTPAQVGSCSGASQQRWTLTADHHIVGNGGKCLAVSSGGAGTGVQIQACAAVSEQRWTALQGGLVLGVSGKCLAATGGAGTAVIAVDCTGSADQSWSVMPVP